MKPHGEGHDPAPGRSSSKTASPAWRAHFQWLADWPRAHRTAMRWLLLAGVFLSGLSLFPQQQGYQRTAFRLGTVQSKAVIAEFDFDINKDPETLANEQRVAMAAVPPVLVYEDSVKAEALAALDQLSRTIVALDQNQTPEELYNDRNVPIPLNAYVALLTLDADAIFAGARAKLKDYFERGIISEETEVYLHGSDRATLLKDGVEWVGPITRFAGPLSIKQDLADAGRQGSQAMAVAEIVVAFAEPNVIYNARATQQRRWLARDGVDRSIGRVLKGEKIIGAHERITRDMLRKLESHEYWMQQKAADLILRDRLLSFAGRALMLLLLLAGFALYLGAYRREILDDLSDLLLVSTTFAGFLLLAGLILTVFKLSGYLVPVAGFAVMSALLYDERFSLVATGFLTATIGLVTNEGLIFIVIVGFGSVAAILSIYELRDRRQLYRLLLYVPLVHLATLAAMGMVTTMAFEEALAAALYLVANPFLAAGFALFAVPLSEAAFGKCTNLTLLELLDLNRPLLRRLMLEAPGTYHHSLMVGTLAEAGASAIGANPLMARVQGYYHDIGKIRKPEYFSENLVAGRKNPHDKLATAMSRLILESHVRDGLTLAKEFGLPKMVRDAIAQHHGTSVMTFFYHKARQKDPQAPATEYCYPGPRPRSREVAVVLLADQIDAASRSLEDPTSSRLRGLIKQLCEKRALDGELDESHLTLKDLADLRNAFLPILTALFHGRPSYPKVEQNRGKVSAGPPAEQAAKTEA
ncbi:MAG: HDIG domain-containing protein [Candidatus Eisenbacteria sp.]|nr:HDIG domain-containing protein [Candidatus Eisenbacteria bacterium]